MTREMENKVENPKDKKASLVTLVMIAVTGILAVSKMSEFAHLELSALSPYFFDLDRAIALVLFLAAAFYFIGISVTGTVSMFIMFGAVLYLGAALNMNLAQVAMIFWLIALIEELLFRSVLLEVIWKYTNIKVALVLSTVAYAALHFQAYGSFNYIAALGLLGFLLGLIYVFIRKWDRGVAVSIVTGIHAIVVVLAFNYGLVTLS